MACLLTATGRKTSAPDPSQEGMIRTRRTLALVSGGSSTAASSAPSSSPSRPRETVGQMRPIASSHDVSLGRIRSSSSPGSHGDRRSPPPEEVRRGRVRNRPDRIETCAHSACQPIPRRGEEAASAADFSRRAIQRASPPARAPRPGPRARVSDRRAPGSACSSCRRTAATSGPCGSHISATRRVVPSPPRTTIRSGPPTASCTVSSSGASPSSLTRWSRPNSANRASSWSAARPRRTRGSRWRGRADRDCGWVDEARRHAAPALNVAGRHRLPGRPRNRRRLSNAHRLWNRSPCPPCADGASSSVYRRGLDRLHQRRDPAPGHRGGEAAPRG